MNNYTFYINSTKEAINEGLNDAVLISWDEYDRDFELLTPMRGNQKAAQFRSPIIYYYPSDSMDVKTLIAQIKGRLNI